MMVVFAMVAWQLVLLPAAASAVDTCYRFRNADEADKAGASDFLLKPVSRMPTSHTNVTKGVYNGLNAGDPVPDEFKWATNGKTDENHNSCKDINGGGLFYAYNYPYST